MLLGYKGPVLLLTQGEPRPLDQPWPGIRVSQMRRPVQERQLIEALRDALQHSSDDG
jgi:hypothetical protein